MTESRSCHTCEWWRLYSGPVADRFPRFKECVLGVTWPHVGVLKMGESFYCSKWQEKQMVAEELGHE